jgi:hypothetical protein
MNRSKEFCYNTLQKNIIMRFALAYCKLIKLIEFSFAFCSTLAAAVAFSADLFYCSR